MTFNVYNYERKNNSIMHKIQNEAINDCQVVILVISYSILNIDTNNGEKKPILINKQFVQ